MLTAIETTHQPTTRPAPAMGDTLLSRIGDTPLLPLHRIAAAEGVSPNVVVFAKAEWFNASGSVKARPALAMIEDGERRGLLTPDKTIIEATSGNTGIALAMIGAAKGYRVKLVMPENVSRERKGILLAYGADLLLTDPLEGIDGAIRAARELVNREPERYFYPDQYNNPANWQSHYHTTGLEIWRQTGGAVTHFVAGIGTSGTLMGTGRRLKNLNPAVEVIAVEPADELAIIEGLKHMETSIVPGIYDPHFPDRKIPVRPDDAHEMARRLAQEEGLFVGYSAGAAAWAAIELAKTLHKDSVIVTIFPDGGEKYLSIAG
ncbi:MAG: PLP-dependent cysteine synthase family protein [Chloroflexi bacterium]|nr:MAG: PLP-dependent cysteine synthase family protein [Chloroflexota bacterium]